MSLKASLTMNSSFKQTHILRSSIILNIENKLETEETMIKVFGACSEMNHSFFQKTCISFKKSQKNMDLIYKFCSTGFKRVSKRSASVMWPLQHFLTTHRYLYYPEAICFTFRHFINTWNSLWSFSWESFDLHFKSNTNPELLS